MQNVITKNRQLLSRRLSGEYFPSKNAPVIVHLPEERDPFKANNPKNMFGTYCIYPQEPANLSYATIEKNRSIMQIYCKADLLYLCYIDIPAITSFNYISVVAFPIQERKRS